MLLYQQGLTPGKLANPCQPLISDQRLLQYALFIREQGAMNHGSLIFEHPKQLVLTKVTINIY